MCSSCVASVLFGTQCFVFSSFVDMSMIMQWNAVKRVSSIPSWYRTFYCGIIHSIIILSFRFWIPWYWAFVCKVVQLRSSAASWYQAYLVCQTQESCSQFRSQRADALHWMFTSLLHVTCTFLGSDVNEWTRCVSLKRCDVCSWSCSGNIETWRFHFMVIFFLLTAPCPTKSHRLFCYLSAFCHGIECAGNLCKGGCLWWSNSMTHSFMCA